MPCDIAVIAGPSVPSIVGSVSWLNAVDDSYRQEFRELFATSFGRVEAELARLRTEFDAKQAQLRAELDAKLSQLEARLRERSAKPSPV